MVNKREALNLKLKALIDLLLEAGATRLLLVGGAVVDILNQRTPKDIDIEVYGLSYEKIVGTLQSAGLRADLVGKSFGIVKTEVAGLDIDLSIPRTENRVGVGHKGFEVQVDPNMSPREAARRRDLTINALALDLVTGEILDFFGGLDDLRNGVLRATDPEKFVEDPLRVLRIMQLLPRKGKIVDPDTIELCRSIRDEFHTLPGERIAGEFEKLLLKADKPSMGLEFLRECGWLKCFPELFALISVPQNPIHHPEGDVWTHTLMVVDRAAELRDHVGEEWRLAFMYAALLHDVGKAVTTDPDTLTAYGYDKAGVPIAKKFLRKLRLSNRVIDRVTVLVETHMRPSQLTKANATEKAWRKLNKKVPLRVLGFLTVADSQGRGGEFQHRDVPEFHLCLKYAEKFQDEPDKPILTGKDLIAVGYKPGPHFRVMLDAAYEAQLDGETRKEVLLKIATQAI